MGDESEVLKVTADFPFAEEPEYPNSDEDNGDVRIYHQLVGGCPHAHNCSKSSWARVAKTTYCGEMKLRYGVYLHLLNSSLHKMDGPTAAQAALNFEMKEVEETVDDRKKQRVRWRMQQLAKEKAAEEKANQEAADREAEIDHRREEEELRPRVKAFAKAPMTPGRPAPTHPRSRRRSRTRSRRSRTRTRSPRTQEVVVYPGGSSPSGAASKAPPPMTLSVPAADPEGYVRVKRRALQHMCNLFSEMHVKMGELYKTVAPLPADLHHQQEELQKVVQFLTALDLSQR